MNGQLKIFSGRANRDLAIEICKCVDSPLGEIEISNFSDGEISVRINENVRGRDIFIVQPTCNPSNTNLMELLIMTDAFKRASAKRITAVIPYYGYARQDRKVEPRVPITAKLVADIITAAGANRILTMDLHVGQIQGFFNIPVDNLFSMPVLIDHIKRKDINPNKLVVVSPDAGGVERARAFAKRLNAALAIIDKRRDKPGEAKVMHIIGDIKDKDIIIVDDIVDTAGTMTEVTKALIENGAKSVRAYATHPVLSGPAVERITNSNISELVVANTIPLSGKDVTCKKIKLLSVAPLLGEAIKMIHNESSVSSLFE